MSTPVRSDATTIVSEATSAREWTLEVYRLRRAAYRIVADCERMLDILHRTERAPWRDAVADALVAGRHLLAVVASTARPEVRLDRAAARQALHDVAREPRQKIRDAMDRLLRYTPDSPEEELLLHDARAVRELALHLDASPTHAAASAAATAARAPAVGASVAGPPRVLIGEDERAIRDLLSRQLVRMGCMVSEAGDGATVLERARAEPPDLILTDINMPRMDGLTLLRHLKQDEITRDIPVIVISSQDDLTTVTTCIIAGAEDHIPKPFEPRLLEARARASLERKRLRDQEREYLARVAQLTSAAEAVERGHYVAGSLEPLAAAGDALARLARVFDRMVGGLQSRQQRLQQRLDRLRHEMSESVPGVHGDAVRSPESPFASGEVLHRRYRIEGQLGKGGMGMVYRAVDLELGEDVAVKVVRRDIVTADPGIVERLKSEIRLARRISHRNVVRLHDLGEWNGTYYITMEYVRGVTIEDLIDRRGRLLVDSTLAIGTQLAEALAVAHEEQIVHRDIKPSNLLVTAEGVLKVMDFGIARSTMTEDKLTRAGFVVGTPHYMGPEVLAGKPAGAAADLFAMGVVLYECLSGRPPFSGSSPLSLLVSMSDGNYIRLGEFVAGVPEALEALIHQLLQFRPEDRPASAGIVAEKLAEIEHAAQSAPTAALEIDLQLIEGLGEPLSS